jgi:propionyl-CoA synthetase
LLLLKQPTLTCNLLPLPLLPLLPPRYYQVLNMHSEAEDCTAVQELTEPNKAGALAVKLPLPPGFMSTLLNHDARFVKAYMAEYPGYYNTGDIGHLDEDGYVYVTSRAEDEIKISGHRISTGSLEEVSASVQCNS